MLGAARGWDLGDQALEGQRRVAERGARGVAAAIEELDEGGVERGVDADGHGVEEEPDEVPGLRAIPTSDGGADHQITLAGEAGEEEALRGAAFW